MAQKPTAWQSLTLTTSYAATGVIDVPPEPTAASDTIEYTLNAWIYGTYVVADSSSAQFYMETSDDGTTWYRQHEYSWSSGVLTWYPVVHTLTASNYTTVGYFTLPWIQIPRRAKKIRYQMKKTTGTGAVTFTLGTQFMWSPVTDTV